MIKLPRTIILIYLFTVAAVARGEIAPGSEVTMGGKIYSITVPQTLDVSNSFLKQKYTFGIDIGKDGNVVNVELMSKVSGVFSANAKKIEEVIKQWKFTPVEINGIIVERSGFYWDIEVGYSISSKRCEFSVISSGFLQEFSVFVPQFKLIFLSVEEVQNCIKLRDNNIEFSKEDSILPAVIDPK